MNQVVEDVIQLPGKTVDEITKTVSSVIEGSTDSTTVVDSSPKLRPTLPLTKPPPPPPLEDLPVPTIVEKKISSSRTIQLPQIPKVRLPQIPIPPAAVETTKKEEEPEQTKQVQQHTAYNLAYQRLPSNHPLLPILQDAQIRHEYLQTEQAAATTARAATMAEVTQPPTEPAIDVTNADEEKNEDYYPPIAIPRIGAS